jgi:hypothetical protein
VFGSRVYPIIPAFPVGRNDAPSSPLLRPCYQSPSSLITRISFSRGHQASEPRAIKLRFFGHSLCGYCSRVNPIRLVDIAMQVLSHGERAARPSSNGVA